MVENPLAVVARHPCEHTVLLQLNGCHLKRFCVDVEVLKYELGYFVCVVFVCFEESVCHLRILKAVLIMFLEHLSPLVDELAESWYIYRVLKASHESDQPVEVLLAQQAILLDIDLAK